MIKALVVFYIALQALISLTLVCSKRKPDEAYWVHPWRIGCLIAEAVLLVLVVAS